MQTASVPSRDEIAPAHRWNLEHIYENLARWEEDFVRVEGMIDAVAPRAGTLGDSPAALAEVLSDNAELGESLDRVFVYANLLRDQDTRGAEAQGMAERVSRLGTSVAEATSFIEPEILAIPDEKLQSFLQAEELSLWRHYLENLLRLKEHTLSPREEQILAMAGDVTRTPRTAFGMLNDADLTFRAVCDESGEEVELTKGRYSSFMESLDRRVRRDAWTSLTEGYESHRNTIAALLSGAVKRDVFYARARGYASSLDSALDPSNIPRGVFHRLIETIAKRRPLFHRYSALRKELLGVDELMVYDLYVPLSQTEGPKYSYDDARRILAEGNAAFGGEYVDALTRGLDSGWVDVFESRGKRSGAYSWGSYGTHPFVLMNFNGTLDHVFTLAHEMGHAMHHYYTSRDQPYVYSHYPIFLAEVASTTSESILMSHLLEVTEDPASRLALLNQWIDQIRGTVITQVMFAEFEHRMHTMAEEGEPLTAETLGDLYRRVFTSTLGPDLSFDEKASLGWARIPHFYTGYYVYQYATGYAAAIALSRRILAGGERERDDYLGFLTAGDSDYPIEILRRAGVDLTTSGPIDDTLDLFESLLDQLEEHISRHGTTAAPERPIESDMTMLDADLLQKVKRKKLDEVEAEWVSRVETSPRDVAWFFAVAREMRVAKSHVKMVELLMLLVDGLAVEGAWEEAFDALREGIALAPRNRELREKAIECARVAYAERTDLEDVIEFFGVEAAEDPLKAFEEMRDWLRFEAGAGFYLTGRGLGKVADVNLALQKVQVKFEKTAPLVVRRDEAAKLLTWIPPEHFMMRRVEDPEGVRAEAKADPGALMRELLKRFGRPMTAAEIRDCMAGIVEGSRWSSWWTKAKSHPQVLSDKRKKNAFVWSDSSEAAEQSVLAEFESASFPDRLELARRHVKRGDAVRNAIVQRLTHDLGKLGPAGSAEAVELHCLLDEFGALPSPSPLALDDVLRRSDAAEVILDVVDRRHREQLWVRVQEIRPDDWATVFRSAFLGERDLRLMSWIYKSIRDAGPEGAAAKLVAESVSSPRRYPRAFVWVAKHVLQFEELRPRANHSLLSRVIDALDHTEFKELKAPLREHFEPDGLAFAVFDQSDREATDRLLSLIDSAGSVEEHRKTEIRRAIFRKYPTIRKRDDDDTLYASLEALETKRSELEQLVKVEIPETTQMIQVAREHGDLRENFEYHAARQKHELLTARAARLNDELRKVRLIDPSSIDPSRIRIGTRVDLTPLEGGPPRAAVILGPWDSDPDRDVFSHRSELAQGLLGARVDDTVQLEGQPYRVAQIRVWR